MQFTINIIQENEKDIIGKRMLDKSYDDYLNNLEKIAAKKLNADIHPYPALFFQLGSLLTVDENKTIALKIINSIMDIGYIKEKMTFSCLLVSKEKK